MKENAMNNNSKKRHFFSARWQVWLIILIPSICVGLATWMYYTGSMIPVGRTNKGTLILPPVQLSSLKLKEKNGQSFTKEQLNDDWGMLILVGSQCDAQCKNVLNTTERVHIALNKDSGRVFRYALVDRHAQILGSTLPAGFDQMQILSMNTAWVKRQLHDANVDMSKTYLLLVDPLGNIMMSYNQKQIGKDVVKDLQKLLRVSNIG